MCVAEDHEFHLSDLRGRFVALHFMPHVGTPDHDAHVKEFLDQAAARAGVIHVFVSAGDAAALKDWWKPLDRPGFTAAHDAGGRLAAELELASGSACALVVLDREGRELFRHIGATDQDHLSFAKFSARLDEAWRPAALAHYNVPKDKPVAVKGYDVVAYFSDSKPTRGKPDITSRYMGVTYQFASTEHRAMFAAAPEKYLPTYGGWCATAMGDGGKKVAIDPTNYKVKDGRLFLFFKGLGGDALKQWNRNESALEPAADDHWRRLTGEDPTKPRK